MALLDLQKNFKKAVLENNFKSLARHVIKDDLLPEERIRIYRNNSILTLTDVLAGNFPVILKLLGDGYFKQLMGKFITLHPPQNPVLSSYGQQLPDFLAEHSELDTYPYLADVARFELLWTQAYHAAACDAFDLEKFQQVPPEDYGALQINLIPSAQFFQSAYPVFEIWQACAKGQGDIEKINLADNPSFTLIFRPQLEVIFLNLDQPGYEFLHLLSQGQPFGNAAGAVLTDHPDFDLQSLLGVAFSEGIFDNYKLLED